MRAYLAVLGVALLVLGLLLMLFLWPLIGFETKDTFTMGDVNGEDKVSYVGEITSIDEYAGIYILELDGGVIKVYSDNKELKVTDRVFVTVQFGKNITNWDENTYTVQKMPTTFGLVGALIFLFGLVMTIAGLAMKRTRIEDVVSFSIQPPIKSPAADGLQPQDQMPAANIEQVTCPKCQNTFGVQFAQKPMNITCPRCSLAGVLK